MAKFSRSIDNCSHTAYIRKALDALPFTKNYDVIPLFPGDDIKVHSDRIGMLIYIEPHELNNYSSKKK